MAEGAALLDGLADDEVARRLDAVAWLGWTEILLEMFEQGNDHVQRGLDVARATGQGHLIAHLLIAQGTASILQGSVGLASERFDEAIEASRLTGAAEFSVWAFAGRSWAAVCAGDVSAAVSFGEQAVELSRGWDDLVAAVAACNLAEALAESGRLERVPELILDAAGGPDLPRLAPGWRPRWHELLTRTALALGDRDAARAWAARAGEVAEGLGLAWASGWASSAGGHVLLAEGELPRAAGAWLEAVAQFEGRGLRLAASGSRLRAGKALAAAGEIDRGATELERAHTELGAMGAVRLRDDAARELRRLGRRVARTGGRGGGTGLAALSRRELEVVELVATGRTNREIAAVLFVSEKTVESHLRRVFEKLGVRSRSAAAAAFARETSTLPAPGS